MKPTEKLQKSCINQPKERKMEAHTPTTPTKASSKQSTLNDSELATTKELQRIANHWKVSPASAFILQKFQKEITDATPMSQEFLQASLKANAFRMEAQLQYKEDMKNQQKESFLKHEDSLMLLPFFTICRLHNLQSEKSTVFNAKFAIVLGANKDGTRAKVQLIKGTYKNIKWSNLKPVVDLNILTVGLAAHHDPRDPPGTESVKDFFNARRYEIKKNKSKRNLCHFACEYHHLKALQWLSMLIVLTDMADDPECLTKECDWDDSNYNMLWEPDTNGCTPLFLATIHSHRPPRPKEAFNEHPGKEQVVWIETSSGTDVIEHLLTNGGPRAAEKINAPIPRRLADSEVEETRYEGDMDICVTPMSKACYNNNLSMVQLLHQYGATCYSSSAQNTKNEFEQPLFCAVKFASCLKIVQYLVQNGAKNEDVCYVDNMGGTPTLFAARWNNFELLKYLTISEDCRTFNALQDAKRPTCTLRTCLGVAFSEQSFEVSQFLILVCNCVPADDYLRCIVNSNSHLRPEFQTTIQTDLIDWSFNMISELAGKDEESKMSMMEYIYETYMTSKNFQTNCSDLDECFVESDGKNIKLYPGMVVAKLFRFSEQLEPKFRENVAARRVFFKKP